MKTEAAIDIGTNTMLLLIAEVTSTRSIARVLDDQIRFVRLGQGVHQNRAFLPEAMERALKCFHEFKALCDLHKVEKINAVATSASRDSKNAREFYEHVRSQTGIEVQIIAGETEARLSFIGGLLPTQDPARSVILDIGGGSTEFVALKPDLRSVHGQSVDVGCLRATEIFLKGDPYISESIEAMKQHLREVWKRLDPTLQEELRHKEWTGIAGTPTTLAGLMQNLTHFEVARLDGFRMKRAAVGEWLSILASQKQETRAANPLMGTGRADIIVAGVAILLTAMEFFGKDEVTVSSRGLRHGVLLEPPVSGERNDPRNPKHGLEGVLV